MSMYLGDRQVIRVRVSWSVEWGDLVGAFDGMVVVHIESNPGQEFSDYYLLGHQFEIVKEGDSVPLFAIKVELSENGSKEFKFVRTVG
jgi:hypothetical protein